MIRLAQRALGALGFKVIRPGSPRHATMAGALKRCGLRGVRPASVIDVGASDGRWSRLAETVWPDARFLLVEADCRHQEALSRALRSRPAWRVALQAAGDIDGTGYLSDSDIYGGCVSDTPPSIPATQVSMARLDTLAANHELQPPFCIKLDTHGFERQILDGAGSLLPKTSLMVIEAYNFRLEPHAMLFHELCAFLDTRGFRCIDVCDPLYRPGDHAWWQCDLFFVKATDSAFERNTYR